MGIFGSKKVTRVFTSVVRVMEDDNLPDTAKRSILRTAIKGGGSVADNLLEDILNGPAISLQRMYNYAKAGHYHYGLPNTQVLNSTAGAPEIKAVLEAQFNDTVTLEYVRFRPLNHVHMGWQILAQDYGYDESTNELTALSATVGRPVYLDTLVGVYQVPVESDGAEPGSTAWWGKSPRAGQTPERPAMANQSLTDMVHPAGDVFTTTGTDAVEIHYIYETTNKVLVRDVITRDLSGYEADREYFQVKYYRSDGTPGYWTYLPDGTYPTVDAVMDMEYSAPGTYFPFVVFRANRTDRTDADDKGTPAYESTTRMLRYLQMDFAEMGKNIHENPDIGDVEQAVMIVAADGNSTDQLELRYLYAFFDRLYGQIPSPTVNSAAAGTGQVRSSDDVVNGNAIVFSDADYKMALSFGTITRKVTAGKLGPIGTYATATSAYTYQYTETNIVSPGETDTVTRTGTVPQRIYRKQIADSFYEELVIDNPTMRYDIYGSYSYLGGSDSDQFVIPIDKDLVSTWGMLDRETLYFRGLKFVFNSRITEKVDWYQTGFFRAVLTIAAIVITVASGGALAPATVTLTSVAWAVLQYIVISLVINFAFKLVVKYLGVEFAMIAAIVAAAVGVGMKLNGAQAFAGLQAEHFLIASSGFSSGIQANTRDQFAQYNAEAQAFTELTETRMKELEVAKDLLGTEGLIDPFEFIGMEPLYFAGESPDDFYQRTIHQGNPGALVFDYLESHVDISLTLPTIHSTIGDTLYG